MRLALALLTLALSAPRPAAAGMAESWYLARGRANVKIGNHAAAIEAFQKALEANPGSREASRSLGLAYLANGETDRAVAQLDRHLARWDDDPDVAFELGRILSWSRYAYRAADAIRVLRMGLARRDDPDRRRDLARLLARDRGTAPDAIREYDRLIAAAPRDRALRHERLKLLLWTGKRGEAISELEALSRGGAKDPAAERQLALLLAADGKRAGEGAERLARILAASPGDAEARLARARALARLGRRDEARAEYARLAARREGGLEARLEHADLLASRPETRAEARDAYARILEAAPGSRRARLGYARLLASERATSGASIPQYRAVVAEHPEDAEAHRGLALAYAWNGDADRALAHGDAARRLGSRAGDVAALDKDLRAGREPAAGGGARLLAQPSGAWPLAGGGAFLSGRADPTPFTTSAVEAGWESYRDEDDVRASGATVAVTGAWRPRPGARLDASVAWAGARRAAPLGGGLRFTNGDDVRAWSIAVERRFRRDSLRAYAGDDVGGRLAGAAADDVVELSARARAGEGQVSGAVRAGAVTAAAGGANGTFGLSARWDRPVATALGFVASAGVAGEVAGWARDEAGLGALADPLAPRYFSPPLFAAASPRFLLVRDEGLRGRVALELGPALQAVGGPGGGFRIGGGASLQAARRVGGVALALDARLEQIGDAYLRAEATASMAVLF